MQELIWTIFRRKTPGAPGASGVTGGCPPKVAYLTGVWEFYEFVQLEVHQRAFVQCPGHRIIVIIAKLLEFFTCEKLYGPMPVVKY
jgi:hypothetical protein